MGEQAAARLERTGAAAVRTGTVQAAEQIDGVVHYVLGLPRPDGGIDRVEGLQQDDLEVVD